MLSQSRSLTISSHWEQLRKTLVLRKKEQYLGCRGIQFKNKKVIGDNPTQAKAQEVVVLYKMNEYLLFCLSYSLTIDIFDSSHFGRK